MTKAPKNTPATRGNAAPAAPPKPTGRATDLTAAHHTDQPIAVDHGAPAVDVTEQVGRPVTEADA